MEIGTSRKNGQWFVLVAAVLWGTTGTAQAFAPSGAQPMTIGAMRLVLGGALLLAWAAARGTLRNVRQWPLLTVAFAASSIAVYQVFFFTAVATTGVAVGTMIVIGSAPILAGVLGFLVRGEHLSRKWIIATVLAVAGCILLISTTGDVSINARGIALALGAGFAYATFTVASKRLLDEQPPDAVMAVVFCLGAILLSPLLFTADMNWLARPRGLAVVLHLGLVATAAAYILFARGLASIQVATAVTLSLAEPLTAGILGVTVLGEQITFLAMLGIGLIFSGLALLSFDSGVSTG